MRIRCLSNPTRSAAGALTASVLAATMVLTPTASAAISFSDIAGDTHEPAIVAVASAGIAGGYPDGTYRPGASVTRGQMATFLTRALDLAPGAPGQFTDIAGDTHADAIAAVATAGIAGGYPDGTYRPGAPVTRAQMATFLSRALNLERGDAGQFRDVDAGATHADAIAAVATAGIAGGYPDGTYRPGAPVTRGQMATFLNRSVVNRPPVYLADIRPVEGNVNVAPAEINGVSYAKTVSVGFFGTRARTYEYNLARSYNRFQAVAGLRDDTLSHRQVNLIIYADGNPVFDQTMGVGTAAAIDLDVTDVLRLRFEIVELGNAGTSATGYASFGNAVLLRS